jgi:hypothetical protein
MKANELIAELRNTIMNLETMMFEGVMSEDSEVDVESILNHVLNK